jgi:hypothetical protein
MVDPEMTRGRGRGSGPRPAPAGELAPGVRGQCRLSGIGHEARRRRTKAFETNPTLEFEFFLAEQLRMPVWELRERLSEAEFRLWAVYYGRKAQREELEMKRAKGG